MDGGRIQLPFFHPMEEYFPRVLFDFTVGNGLESFGLLESITESSNSREQIQDPNISI
jgi:hypothetical protein